MKISQVLEQERVTAASVARHLGISRQAVGMKLAGMRSWRANEMAAVRDYLGEVTGREYTVDELFFEPTPRAAAS